MYKLREASHSLIQHISYKRVSVVKYHHSDKKGKQKVIQYLLSNRILMNSARILFRNIYAMCQERII